MSTEEPIQALRLMIDQAEMCTALLEHVRMDTAEDQELHRRVTAESRAAIDRMRRLTGFTKPLSTPYEVNHPPPSVGPVPDPRVVKMTRLLAEATEHALAEDGHCKSSEGAISVAYPPFAWREEGYPERFPEPSVSVFSYVLGPHREHYFSSLDEALATVQEWHAEEMAREPEEES